MPKKIAQTKVTVNQVSTVELTKRGSSNSLQIEVRSGNEMLGTLVMGKGSVQRWPRGNTANKFHKNWRGFAALLDRAMKK